MEEIIPVSIGVLAQVENSQVNLFVQKRKEDGPLDGLLEFPGGKIEALETPKKALLRELREEIGFSFKGEDFDQFTLKVHSYKDRKVALYVFLSIVKKGPWENNGMWLERKGADTKDLKGKIPCVNHEIIELVYKYIQKQKENKSWRDRWS